MLNAKITLCICLPQIYCCSQWWVNGCVTARSFRISVIRHPVAAVGSNGRQFQVAELFSSVTNSMHISQKMLKTLIDIATLTCNSMSLIISALLPISEEVGFGWSRLRAGAGEEADELPGKKGRNLAGDAVIYHLAHSGKSSFWRK